MTFQVVFLAAGHPHLGDSLEVFYPHNLIEVSGKSIIERSLSSLDALIEDRGSNLIVCLGALECEEYFTDALVRLLYPAVNIIYIQGTTSGALCTAMLTLDALNEDEPIIIANGDQVFQKGISSEVLHLSKHDAGTITFSSVHPRWSYVITESGRILEVAEKRPLSSQATCGVFYFRNLSFFLFAGEQTLMKRKPKADIFYLAPALNELILRGDDVRAIDTTNNNYHSLSTRDDITNFSKLTGGNL
jgi:dTDP-glucose pyrophosphorylase